MSRPRVDKLFVMAGVAGGVVRDLEQGLPALHVATGCVGNREQFLPEESVGVKSNGGIHRRARHEDLGWHARPDLWGHRLSRVPLLGGNCVSLHIGQFRMIVPEPSSDSQPDRLRPQLGQETGVDGCQELLASFGRMSAR